MEKLVKSSCKRLSAKTHFFFGQVFGPIVPYFVFSDAMTMEKSPISVPGYVLRGFRRKLAFRVKWLQSRCQVAKLAALRWNEKIEVLFPWLLQCFYAQRHG